MEKIKHNMGTYDLHLIKATNFRTVQVDIIFRRQLVKDEISIRRLLFSYLRYSSQNYKTNRELAIAEAKIYDPSIGVNNSFPGKIAVSAFTATILNEKYTEKGMLELNINFLLEFIFKPNFDNGKCDEKILNILKEKAHNAIKRSKENKMRCALEQALDNMGEDYINYRSLGYDSDIDKITPELLYKYYLDVLKNDCIDIYVVGEFDFDATKDIFKKNFVVENNKNECRDLIHEHQNIKEVSTVISEEELNQSSLVMTYKTANVTAYERAAVSLFYDYILGGSMTSKLFLTLREKNSLCYSINSDYGSNDNLLMIRSGIDADKFDMAVELITKEFESMKLGDFTNEDVEIYRKRRLDMLIRSKDNASTIIRDDYYDSLVYGEEINSDEYYNDCTMKVTKDDIVGFANKIKLDTISLLKGVSHEEN